MLKVGIVGVGHFGKNHVRCHKLANFELVGFYDINKETSENVEKEFDIKSFPSLQALINEVDVIDVVVPTSSHFDVAKTALENGKHVFIEKPVTSTLEQAAELKRIAGERNLKIQVGHVERFNPAFRAIKDKISAPKFIELHRLGQFHPRNKDVPVVLDLLIHDLDIVLHLVKSKIKKVHSSGVAIISDTPDITNARVEFEDGCVVNMTSSRISMKTMRKTRIFQETAYITVDFLEKKSEYIQVLPVKEPVDDPFALILDLGDDRPKKQFIIDTPDVKEHNAIVEELNSFYNSIINNTTPEVSIDDGYNALNLAKMIMEHMNK
ncbi:MAG: Gfo/Idh/MocA family oxidoreductase [Bacteroidales bacterium]|jgi:predicted dehydrogenase|nr:Gfo/Idh/MocA family oxidoreductase [Bacteroidales bacterium]